MKLSRNLNFPLVTLTLAAMMVIITILWTSASLCVPFSNTCNPDWRTPFGFAILTVWLFVHPFVHLNLNHLVGDLAGFIFVGSLVEVGMVRVPRRTRYSILLIGYGISIFLNVRYFTWGGAIAGSSVLTCALLPVTLYYWLKFHDDIRLRWSSMILIGLVLLLCLLGYEMFMGQVRSAVVHFLGLDLGVPIPIVTNFDGNKNASRSEQKITF